MANDNSIRITDNNMYWMSNNNTSKVLGIGFLNFEEIPKTDKRLSNPKTVSVEGILDSVAEIKKFTDNALKKLNEGAKSSKHKVAFCIARKYKTSTTPPNKRITELEKQLADQQRLIKELEANQPKQHKDGTTTVKGNSGVKARVKSKK